MNLPQPPYTYATGAAANVASNQLYLSVNPQGTTELLWGWTLNEQGQYQLAVPYGLTPSI